MAGRLPFAVLLIASASMAQTPGATAPQTSQTPAQGTPQLQRHQPSDVQPSGITLSTATQLVVVDVVVENKAGQPVHGLKAADFQLIEGKTPQTPKSFEEHTTADLSKVKIQKLPPMPPGIFTDYTPVPEGAALNVLLLDAINTPMKDQSYVRYQLQQYVKHANPGTRIAIFGLNQRLILLQGFSSDPEILKNVVDHKLLPRASNLLDDPVSGGSVDQMSDFMSDAGASASAVAGMQQFEAQNATFQTTLRTEYTLEAFNQLARYLAGFPGRKNLLWFSGSFPLTIFGDPNLEDPFAAQADFSDELRQTTGLLDRARVAVYPIDARGLQTAPMFDASNSGRGYARNPGKFGQDLQSFSANNAQEHMSMDEIADETGGHAFYNTNGLAEAVTKAIDAGSNYYTFTYSPLNHDWNGTYRTIHVKLLGDTAALNLKLAYRNGYYADDPNNVKTSATSSLIAGSAVSGPAAGTAAHAMAAMQRGAPMPSEILFKARVLPDTTTTSDAIVANNTPNPKLKQKGPFRLYDVDFATVASDLQLTQGPDGLRHGEVEFVALVYDVDGTLLNAEGDTVQMNLPQTSYDTLRRSGLKFRLQVSAPAKGESFLRIAVHDIRSGKYGVIEEPTSLLSRLTPVPPLTPPAATPSSPAATTSPAAPTSPR